MNTNKNPNLPANAIRTVAVKPGMVLVDSYGTVRTVARVSWMGHRGRVFFTSGVMVYVNGAGTMRLA